MSGDVLTEKVLRFLGEHVASVEQLEILLLLSNEPERVWSVEEVFQTIQSSRTSIIERLKVLQQHGFLQIQEEGQTLYRFEPATVELREGVSELKAAYRKTRVKIIESIYSHRLDQVRIFADAFKLRKD